MVLPGLINTPLVKMLADKNAGGNQEAFCKKRTHRYQQASIAAGLLEDHWVANLHFLESGRCLGCCSWHSLRGIG